MVRQSQKANKGANSSVMKNRYSRQFRRNNRGNQLAEFGPGLLILFGSTFFPLILLIALGVTYGCGYTLNNLQIREAAVLTKTEAESATGNVKKNIPEYWQSQGIGQFASIVGPPITQVSYKKGQIDNEGRQDWIVVVNTKIEARPFLMGMPFIPGIPGLTSAAPFTYESEAVIENPDDHDK